VLTTVVDPLQAVKSTPAFPMEELAHATTSPLLRSVYVKGNGLTVVGVGVGFGVGKLV
jgi:hypothetical protein